MAEQHDVVVVGAGLAGLACARALPRHLDVLVLEAGDAVGGRVRTDRVDGFLLDRGFQVLNTGYPELRRRVDLDALDLRPFAAAAGLHLDGRRYVLGNPLQQPATLRDAPALPVGGLRGKAALASYAARCLALPPRRLKARDDVPAPEAWRRAGVPDEVATQVLRAFFAGVVLEQELTVSRRFTDLMMRMFVVGASTVPAAGMQALPEQLAAWVQVRLDHAVREVTPTGVRTDHGEIGARCVVVATDAWTARDLLPGARGLGDAPPPRGVTTVYHSAPRFESASPMLLLDQAPSPIANSLAISEAAPTYAPPGKVLVATSLVHPAPDPDGADVRARLARLHGTDTSGWEVVATYDLPHALPGMPAPHPFRRPVRLEAAGGPVYVAGDHRDTSSIQGALVSGRRAARAVLADLRRSR